MSKPSVQHTDDFGKLLLRVTLAGILLFHGVYKLTHGVEWIKPRLAQVGLPGALANGTYLAEVVAPLLLIVGYRVRLAALIIAFDMCMAIGLVLRPQIFALSPTAGGGWAIELQALILLAAISVALLGGGPYGIDRRKA
jgi:putative oxidoreductase